MTKTDAPVRKKRKLPGPNTREKREKESGECNFCDNSKLWELGEGGKFTTWIEGRNNVLFA